MTSFHIQRNPPTKPWPNGSWSLYKINGDEIAERVIFKEIHEGQFGPHYRGGVIARHSWCGYIGLYETLDELQKAIASNAD
jgi:hypothetical protein